MMATNLLKLEATLNQELFTEAAQAERKDSEGDQESFRSNEDDGVEEANMYSSP